MRPTKPLRDHTYEELDALQRACFNDRYETERTLDAIAREAVIRFVAEPKHKVGYHDLITNKGRT